MAGFTTVQSVGAPNDIPLRDAIAKGIIPGPRILTAVEPLEGQGEKTGSPDEIRAFIRTQKAAGADLICAQGGEAGGRPGRAAQSWCFDRSLRQEANLLTAANLHLSTRLWASIEERTRLD